MICVEFCGLPASGKSSFIEKFRRNGSIGLDALFIKPKGFLMPKKDMGLFYLFRILINIFINFFFAPHYSFCLARSILFQRVVKDDKRVVRLIVALQYHVNHYLLQKSLREKNSNNSKKIYIIDGSPLNMLLDCWDFEIDQLIHFYKEIYIGRSKPLIIFSDSSLSSSIEKMGKRFEQPLEPILYSNSDALSIANDKLLKVSDSLKLKVAGFDYLRLNLFDPVSEKVFIEKLYKLNV